MQRAYQATAISAIFTKTVLQKVFRFSSCNEADAEQSHHPENVFAMMKQLSGNSFQAPAKSKATAQVLE
jgi:hypothetical protein